MTSLNKTKRKEAVVAVEEGVAVVVEVAAGSTKAPAVEGVGEETVAAEEEGRSGAASRREGLAQADLHNSVG